jgi:hypothetical protein
MASLQTQGNVDMWFHHPGGHWETCVSHVETHVKRGGSQLSFSIVFLSWWLVVGGWALVGPWWFQPSPLKNDVSWVRQDWEILGVWNSQLNGKITNVPNHQPNVSKAIIFLPYFDGDFSIHKHGNFGDGPLWLTSMAHDG